MGEDAAEGIGANVTLAYVGVAIHMRGPGELTVVGMNHVHVGETEQGFGTAQGIAKAGLRDDIETRGQQMTGIEAVADREIGKLAGEIADRLKFLQATAQVASGARGIFQEDSDLVGGQTLRRVTQSKDEGGDALFDGRAPVTSGMQDEILSANRVGAFQFPAEGTDRLAPNHRIERGQVDQVVDVDG